jgi:hypothetical protein
MRALVLLLRRAFELGYNPSSSNRSAWKSGKLGNHQFSRGPEIRPGFRKLVPNYFKSGKTRWKAQKHAQVLLLLHRAIAKTCGKTASFGGKRGPGREWCGREIHRLSTGDRLSEISTLITAGEENTGHKAAEKVHDTRVFYFGEREKYFPGQQATLPISSIGRNFPQPSRPVRISPDRRRR